MAPETGRDRILALSARGKIRGGISSPGNAATAEAGQAGKGGDCLPQKGALETKLKLSERTIGFGKESLKMLEGLKQRIGMGAGGWSLLSPKQGSQTIQLAQENSPHAEESFQGKRQSQFFGRRFQRKTGKYLEKPGPQASRGQSVAWQDAGQKNGEGAPTPATPPAIGTIGALPALRLLGNVAGIVAT